MLVVYMSASNPKLPRNSGAESHDSFFESDELLLLLLPALKVSIDQRLELHQILVLTLLLDVL